MYPVPDHILPEKFLGYSRESNPGGWVYPVPDPILPEKFLGYSRQSKPGTLGWQSDVLTTIPNKLKKKIAIVNFIGLFTD